MRYWLYKNNRELGGPAGYWGDWRSRVFKYKRTTEWGGHYATRSFEVYRYLDEELAAGDVIVAYQTDEKEVVGFCRVERVTGSYRDRRIYLKPIELLAPPFRLHERKRGTLLESSQAVNGRVMLRELGRREMQLLVKLSGAPARVMKGEAAPGGYRPPKT